MSVTVRADQFAEDMTAKELGEILAVLAGDFREDHEAFSGFIQEACKEARNHHRMPDDLNPNADAIYAAFGAAAARYTPTPQHSPHADES